MAINRFLNLPADVRHTYFSLFEIKELCRLSRTCKAFKAFVEHPEFWKKIYPKMHPLALSKNPRATFHGDFLEYPCRQEVLTTNVMMACSLQRDGFYLRNMNEGANLSFMLCHRDETRNRALPSPPLPKDKPVGNLWFSRGSNTRLATVLNTQHYFVWDSRSWQCTSELQTLSHLPKFEFACSPPSPIIHDPSNSLLLPTNHITGHNFMTAHACFIDMIDLQRGIVRHSFPLTSFQRSFDIFRANLLTVEMFGGRVTDLQTAKIIATLNCANPSLKSIVTADAIGCFITSSEALSGSSVVEHWDHRWNKAVNTFQCPRPITTVACQDLIVACHSVNTILFYDIRRSGHFLTLPSPTKNLPSLHFYGDGIMAHSSTQIAFIDFKAMEVKKHSLEDEKEMPPAKKVKK